MRRGPRGHRRALTRATTKNDSQRRPRRRGTSGGLPELQRAEVAEMLTKGVSALHDLLHDLLSPARLQAGRAFSAASWLPGLGPCDLRVYCRANERSEDGKHKHGTSSPRMNTNSGRGHHGRRLKHTTHRHCGVQTPKRCVRGTRGVEERSTALRAERMMTVAPHRRPATPSPANIQLYALHALTPKRGWTISLG